jgi:hypothetical protein
MQSHAQNGCSRTRSVLITALVACPNLGSLALHSTYGFEDLWPADDSRNATYPQLHTLALGWHVTAWHLTHLPSLTALLLDGYWDAKYVQNTVNQVPSQLTRLRVDDASQLLNI